MNRLITALAVALLASACLFSCSKDAEQELSPNDTVEAETPQEEDQPSTQEPEGEALESTIDDEDAAEETAPESREEMTDYTMEEVWFTRDGMSICGHLYLPAGEGPYPLVIMGHGFGGSMIGMKEYAMSFAESGIAACAFDFIGGGYAIQSDGDLTEMSVLTEAADMNTVMNSLAVRGDIDPGNIFLMGQSQGGLVATYVAGTHPDSVRGLICLYPAYMLHDDVRVRTPDPNNIPETVDILGITVGRIYCEDLLSFDIYGVMANYPGPVLIIHGTADGIAPISYSRRAADTMPNAQLLEIEGADHGFFGAENQVATETAIQFVQSNMQ